MFDIGFSELLLIAVVALVVLGPERLPKAARLAGLWARKARTQWNAVKAELENELADEELRRNLRDTTDALRDGAQQARAMTDSLRSDLVLPAIPEATQTPPAGAAEVQVLSDTAVQAAPEAEAIPSATDATPAQRDHDPAQLSLLDPDPAFQMMALPSVSKPTSDD